MYQLILRKNAQKNLKKIDGRYRKRIEATLVKLKFDAWIGKPLDGDLKGLYSVRTWPYRIIYEIYDEQLIILIVRIAHRQGVYKDLK